MSAGRSPIQSSYGLPVRAPAPLASAVISLRKTLPALTLFGNKIRVSRFTAKVGRRVENLLAFVPIWIFLEELLELFGLNEVPYWLQPPLALAKIRWDPDFPI